jgi:hypothetical protein
VVQLPKTKKMSYRTLQDRFDFNLDEISPAKEKDIEQVFGISEAEKTPEYSKIYILKDNSLMSYPPKSAKLDTFASQIKKKAFERFIDTISHPSVKVNYFKPDSSEKIKLSIVEQEKITKEDKKVEETKTQKKPHKTETKEDTKNVPKKVVKKEDSVSQIIKKGLKTVKEMQELKKEKHEDFGKWYQKTLTQSEMIEYYDISG